jgi:hypothetical protein
MLTSNDFELPLETLFELELEHRHASNDHIAVLRGKVLDVLEHLMHLNNGMKGRGTSKGELQFHQQLELQQAGIGVMQMTRPQLLEILASGNKQIALKRQLLSKITKAIS